MEIPVFVLGDIDFTYRILIAIQMLYSGMAMHLMAGVLLILYVLWCWVKWMLNPQNTPYPMREFVYGIIFYMIFGGLDYISPRLDVRLETDTYQNRPYQAYVVTDVPVIAAVPAYITTSLFSGLRDTLATLLYIPGQHTDDQYPGMTNGLDPLSVLLRINDLSNQVSLSPYLEKTIYEYMINCYVPYQSMTGSPTSPDIEALMNKPVHQVWSAATVPVNWLFTNVYDTANPSGINDSCDDIHAYVTSTISSNFVPDITDYLNNKNISSNDLNSASNLIYMSLTGSTTPGPYDFVAGKFISTYMNQGLIDGTAGMWGNKMMFEASQKRIFERAGEANLFVQTMVPVITAIEAFSFFIAPLLMLLTVLGGMGISYIGKYLVLVIFINLWGFVKIFTDFFMLLSVYKAFNADLTTNSALQPFSLNNQYHSFLEIENLLSTASTLTTAIPIFATFLLFGGVHSIMGILGKMTGGSVDASNISPTMGSTMNGGTMQMGDRGAEMVLSTGTLLKTHEVGTSAFYGTEAVNSQISSAANDVYSSALSNVRSQQTSLGNSLNSLFQTASSGSTVVSGGQTDNYTLSAGVNKANQVAEGISVSGGQGRSESAQGMSRLAASAALQLRSGGGGKTADQFTDAERTNALTKTLKAFGLGGDVSAMLAQQLTEGENRDFRELMDKALRYTESDSQGENFSQGFNFSNIDSTTVSGGVTNAVNEVETNAESLQTANTKLKQAQDLVQDTSGVGASKAVQWGVAGSNLAQFGYDGFDAVFSGISEEAQNKMFKVWGADSSDQLYSKLAQEFKTSDVAKLFKSSGDYLKGLKEFDDVAEIYRSVGRFAGDYQYGFVAAADSYQRVDDTRSIISDSSDKLAAPTNTDQTIETGPVNGSAKVKNEASSHQNAEPMNKPSIIADNAGLVAEDGTPRAISPSVKTGLDVSPQAIIPKISEFTKELSGRQSKFEGTQVLAAGIDLIDGMAGGIQNISDFFNPKYAWGENAEEWSQVASGIAASTGLHSNVIQPGLQDLAQMDAPGFSKLIQGLREGDTDSFLRLSSMNDAALFLTNTEAGMGTLQQLSPEDRQRTVNAIQTVESVLKDLPENSPISSEALNQLSLARMKGAISDGESFAIVEGAVPRSFATDDVSSTEDKRSLAFSAAMGPVSQMPELYDLVYNSGSDVITSSILSDINMSADKLVNLEEQAPWVFKASEVWKDTARYAGAAGADPISDVIDDLKLNGQNSEFYYSLSNSHTNNIIHDTVDTSILTGGLVTDENGYIQGFNSELINGSAVHTAIQRYSTEIIQRDDSGNYMDYSERNSEIIQNALGNNVFVMPGTEDESRALAFSSVYSGVMNFGDRVNMVSDGNEQATRLQMAWGDLQEKAIDSGLVVRQQDQSSELKSREGIEISFASFSPNKP
tara:strand:+ start:3227 stop:7444 length:4218 start_codon:yes stop_codon:yes gene_type:complete